MIITRNAKDFKESKIPPIDPLQSYSGFPGNESVASKDGQNPPPLTADNQDYISNAKTSGSARCLPRKCSSAAKVTASSGPLITNGSVHHMRSRSHSIDQSL